MAGLLVESTSIGILLARYRWVFLLLAVASLACGFYLNALRQPARRSRTVFWIASVFTIAAIVHWEW